MALQPGFTDEGGGRDQPAASAPEIVDATIAPSAPPMLLDTVEQGPGDRIDQGWAPEIIKPPKSGRSSLSWLAAGLALLLIGWVGLTVYGFLHDQFARSTRLGYLALAILSVAAGLVLRGLAMEVRTYNALRQVDAIRAALSRFDMPLADAKRLSASWLDTVASRLVNPDVVRTSIAAATDLPELRAILRSRVLVPLDQSASLIARNGAVQGGAVVAIVPSPALDGLFAGIRGLSMMRQIAEVYGLRPGMLVTVSLLKRVSWTAAGVAGTDFLAQSVAGNVLHAVPVIKHLAEAIPSTSVAALRLYRLGRITAKACSPLSAEW